MIGEALLDAWYCCNVTNFYCNTERAYWLEYNRDKYIMQLYIFHLVHLMTSESWQLRARIHFSPLLRFSHPWRKESFDSEDLLNHYSKNLSFISGEVDLNILTTIVTKIHRTVFGGILFSINFYIIRLSQTVRYIWT